jgi:hypothetical protein
MMTKFNANEFNKEQTWRILEGKEGTWYQETSDDERQAMKEWTTDLLKERKITVEFTKADGSLRKMNCTLNESAGAVYVNKLPTEKEEAKKPNPDVCVVWDCDANGWRSFRWDRLKRIDFSIG